MTTRYINPGTETLADRLNAVRDLACCASAASAEITALKGGALNKSGDMVSIEIDDASDRRIDALDALMLEVRALDAGGHIDDLVDLVTLS